MSDIRERVAITYKGAPGKSAYELWRQLGNEGTVEEYLATVGDAAAGEAVAAAQALIEADVAAAGAAKDDSVAARDTSVAARDISVAASATSVAARDVATTARDVATAARDTATVQATIATGKAGESLVSASEAAVSATSALSAAAQSIGAVPFNTKAAANTGLSGLAANAYAMVHVDESQGNQVTLYQKVSGAYVPVRVLPDITTDALTEKLGFAGHLRNSQLTLAAINRTRLGGNGAGNPDYFPTALTASQSGTAVTASTAFFNKNHVGAIMRWASGEFAVIRSVSGYVATATCIVDRTQTVASAAATVDAKHFGMVLCGDSVGILTSIYYALQFWRAAGFGGYIFRPNNIDTIGGTEIGRYSMAGGATEVVDDLTYGTFAWSSYFNLPSGGSVQWDFNTLWPSGTAERRLAHGMKPAELAFNRTEIAWERAAGAFTVHRRRSIESAWELIDTIADASTGTREFNWKAYTHDLRWDWEYKVTATSGTVKVVQMKSENNTRPGMMLWPLNKGGKDLTQLDDLSANRWRELCELNAPDLFLVASADGTASTDVAVYTTEVETTRAWLVAGAPRSDIVWMGMWEGETTGVPNEARNVALRRTAIKYDDGFVSFVDLFGDFATTGTAFMQDAIHLSKRGSFLTAWMIERVLGLLDHANLAIPKDVNAEQVKAGRELTLQGYPQSTRIDAIQGRIRGSRGARWNSNASTLINSGALAGAIGTADFTIEIELTVPAAPAAACYYAVINADGGVATVNGIDLYQVADMLRLVLRNGAGDTYEYRWAYFGTVFAGRTGKLVVRSDRATGRVDLFFDGKPIAGEVTPTINTAGTGPIGLATWSGAGACFAIPQAALIGNCTFVYGAAYWPSRLSDAEILANAYAGKFTTTAPDFWLDLAEGIGRVALDQSGNLRDFLWAAGNPNQYSISGGPTWAAPKRAQLGPMWRATLGATTALIPGDNIVAEYTGARDMLLPAAPKAGDMIRVVGQGAGDWKITQPALHQIRTGAGATVGTNATTIGTGGHLNPARYDAITLQCIRAEAGVAFEWAVVSASGAPIYT